MKEVQNVPKLTLDNIERYQEDEFLTTYEVAQMLRCSEQVVRNLAKAGKLPHINVNVKKKLYSKKGVLGFLKLQHKITTERLAATTDHPGLPKLGDTIDRETGKIIRNGLK